MEGNGAELGVAADLEGKDLSAADLEAERGEQMNYEQGKELMDSLEVGDVVELVSKVDTYKDRRGDVHPYWEITRFRVTCANHAGGRKCASPVGIQEKVIPQLTSFLKGKAAPKDPRDSLVAAFTLKRMSRDIKEDLEHAFESTDELDVVVKRQLDEDGNPVPVLIFRADGAAEKEINKIHAINHESGVLHGHPQFPALGLRGDLAQYTGSVYIEVTNAEGSSESGEIVEDSKVVGHSFLEAGEAVHERVGLATANPFFLTQHGVRCGPSLLPLFMRKIALDDAKAHSGWEQEIALRMEFDIVRRHYQYAVPRSHSLFPKIRKQLVSLANLIGRLLQELREELKSFGEMKWRLLGRRSIKDIFDKHKSFFFWAAKVAAITLFVSQCWAFQGVYFSFQFLTTVLIPGMVMLMRGYTTKLINIAGNAGEIWRAVLAGEGFRDIKAKATTDWISKQKVPAFLARVVNALSLTRQSDKELKLAQQLFAGRTKSRGMIDEDSAPQFTPDALYDMAGEYAQQVEKEFSSKHCFFGKDMANCKIAPEEKTLCAFTAFQVLSEPFLATPQNDPMSQTVVKTQVFFDDSLQTAFLHGQVKIWSWFIGVSGLVYRKPVGASEVGATSE